MNNAIRHRCREARAASPEHQVKKIRAVKKTGKKKTGKKKTGKKKTGKKK